MPRRRRAQGPERMEVFWFFFAKKNMLPSLAFLSR
jgi:hypothetical protein